MQEKNEEELSKQQKQWESVIEKLKDNHSIAMSKIKEEHQSAMDRTKEEHRLQELAIENEKNSLFRELKARDQVCSFEVL